MGFISEVIKFIIYCSVIVLISKYILVKLIRRLGENLKLSSKAIGSIAGFTTSAPELLTVAASSINGLMGASLYNILSSNVINFVQYMASIFINKNQKLLKNKVIKVDIVLVIATILLPIIFIAVNLEINILTVVIFLILYFIFKRIDENTHKLYMLNSGKDESAKNKKKHWVKSIKYIVFLILTSILLFIVGDMLGKTLENLCYRFNIPELVVGILLGIITSIPELITFFESQKHHKQSNNDEEGVIEATNNLFTSNILNLFIIQSIGVLIYTFFA